MKTTLKVKVEAVGDSGTETLYKTQLEVADINVKQLIAISKGFSKVFRTFVDEELPRVLEIHEA